MEKLRRYRRLTVDYQWNTLNLTEDQCKDMLVRFNNCKFVLQLVFLQDKNKFHDKYVLFREHGFENNKCFPRENYRLSHYHKFENSWELLDTNNKLEIFKQIFKDREIKKRCHEGIFGLKLISMYKDFWMRKLTLKQF